jgi:molybdopterin-containing oxidoreductase family iron-sulfur binding subunit
MMSEFSKSNNAFWKSIEGLNNDPIVQKLKENEFIEGVTEEFHPSQLSGISRRKFLALLSASAAVSATACTDYQDKGEIIPYNKRPQEVLPGVSNFYASTCNGCSLSCGILVKTREGRPIKIDGNPDHPINEGKICTKGQASILNLYDPERLKEPALNNRKISWEEADNEIINVLNSAVQKNKEISILVGDITSPTTKKVLDKFSEKYPTTKIYSYSLVNQNTRSKAWFECYNTYEFPSIKFDEADVIFAIDSDFLVNEDSYLENMRLYTKRREVIGKTDFNRLYVAEGRMSATGMMADYRLRISPDEQFEFVMSLISELLKKGSSIELDSASQSAISSYSLNKFLNKIGKEKLNYLIDDLNKSRGKSIVYAGSTLPKEVHLAVNLLNEILGNTNLYNYTNESVVIQYQSSKEDFDRLMESMKNGNVDVLIHFENDPAFHLPQDYEYHSSVSKVKTVISLSESLNESCSLSHYILPLNNQLECWGDSYVRTGVYGLQQPVISPIFNTRQKESILLTWINGSSSSFSSDIYHKFLIENFTQTIYPKLNAISDAKSVWLSSLHDGVVTLKNDEKSHKKLSQSWIPLLKPQKENLGLTLHLTESYFVGDGYFANNGWLQEVPHPITKVTWDNYAAVSPLTAKKLNLENNDLIEISVDQNKIIIPVFVQPGLSDNMINIEYGYGRKIIGDVGKDVGINPLQLISKNQFESKFVLSNVSIKKAEGKHQLVTTQEHHSLDDTFVKDFHRIRKIIQEGTVENYKKNPKFLHEHKHELFSITREHTYTGNKWAMAIDLNKCTSCAACVTSCNVENNIPVVGKDQVGRGREMHWMRIDRYYSGSPEEPIASNQPMLCQHCDNAPCENVCPVNATNHSPDGLNQMVYNRCVGTRYCSNNCPYKVRRYNFFDFRDHFADEYYQNDLTALVNNPEVTVRSRGVMEKCTFCVQRIMDVRSNAISEGREINPNEVVTACQQACPTNAITFGDANNPNSSVAKLRNHNLTYHVLEELNIKPNVTYIAKLRNTHSEDNS